MNRVALLTGATSGIGREAALRLADRGWTVLFTGRDREAGREVRSAVRDAHPDGDGEFYRADFAEFDAVRELAREVRADYDRLDALVNNAGTSRSERWTTAEGIELTFAVNHLAPFLLTNLLASRLRESAPARVVTTSSALHEGGSLADLESVVRGENFDGLDAYADSKLANVLFTRELAARLDGTGVTANCVHPGWIPHTDLVRNATGFSRLFTSAAALVATVAPVGPFESVEGAAEALVYLTTSDAVADVSGAYFDRKERSSAASAADDPDLRRRLWERSAELVGLPASVPEGDVLRD
ncbi:SDR family oxidoreductase [Halorussus gelatinilyticus]|uniref:SDR family oxidoreductase n=1 Tax=Halorussus gelatinilyticus TaxID=2937524 RepID=A0A8U0IN01_9EURY|nr:SDR family oxidoreductase [Halorussus gelatinilyticus]UPW01554.1 SDR family oxidoreductase [Halorussus gelatinilyticus]